MTLVLFHPVWQEIRIWKPFEERSREYLGYETLPWIHIWFAIDIGWEVIGEL